MFHDGKEFKDSASIANAFNNFFYDNFNSNKFSDSNVGGFVNANLSELIVTEDMFWDIMNKLDKNKAHGCDGLPVYFYITFADVLKSSIALLFNSSLYCGLLPYELI